MLKLSSARILQAVMGGAITTTAPSCVVGFSDKAVGGAGYDGDAKLTDLNGTTAVTVCAAPASSTNRHIDYLTLRNNDSVQQVFTVRYNESAVLTTLIMATLGAGEMLGFTHSNGWYVNTADGSRKSGAVQDLSGYLTILGAAAGYQPLDLDLTIIAALAPNNDDVLQRQAGAWTARSPAQIKTDLVLVKADVGLANVDNTADTAKPVSTAQQTALDLKANAANAALTGTPTAPTAAAATNTTQIASTAFVHTEVSNAVTGLLHFQGATDCSTNPNYPAAVKGDSYIASVAGKIGGASGTAVDIGDWFIAEADNAGGTEASVGTSWAHLEHNLVGALLAANNLSDLASASAARGNLGLGALATVTPGTGVATALAVNVGSAGAPVVNGGALGTPSSGTLTNATGLPEAGLALTDITTNNATASAHGFLKKLSNAAGDFMNGVGNWVAAAALATANTFTAAQRGSIVALTDQATIALDLSLANQYGLVLGGSRTLDVPTNIVAGQQGTVSIRQDATGSRTLAYAWPYVWAGGTAGVLSTPGCTRDLLGYSVDAYNSAVVTITIAAPGVISMTAHGFSTGQRFQIATTGALPTGLSTATTYFASVVDANSFKACASLANAAAGTFITTSGSQSGVHTLTGCTISLNLSKAFA